MRWILLVAGGAAVLIVGLTVFLATNLGRTGSPTAGGRRSHRTWLVGGSVATAVSVLLAGSTAWSWLAHVSAQTETGSDTYRGTVTQVEVDVDHGSVTLVPGPAGQVGVERTLTWTGPEPTIEETWYGETLQVVGRCPDRRVLFRLDCTVNYRIRVPPDVTVDVTSHSGRIEVRDLDGPVRLAGATDSVAVANATGPLTVRTTSGDVTGSGLRSRRVDVDVTTGNVDLSFAAPPERVTVEATTGNPTIVVPGGDRYRVSVDTTTGTQQVDLVNDPDATRAITVRTTSGDVRIEQRP